MADLNDLRDAIEHDPAAVAELLTPTIDRLRSEAEPSPGELLHALVLRGRARQALGTGHLARGEEGNGGEAHGGLRRTMYKLFSQKNLCWLCDLCGKTPEWCPH